MTKKHTMDIDLNNPNDVNCSEHFHMFRFKTHAKAKKISLENAQNKLDGQVRNGGREDYITLTGFRPGDGFVKDKPGVYIFVDTEYSQKVEGYIKKYLYVGKAKTLRNRMLQHFIYDGHIINKMEPDDGLMMEVYVWYMENPEAVEKHLIEKLKPKYNINFNR